MSVVACTLYFPGDPEGLFKFLDQSRPSNTKLLLWVDNDDHKVSSEFYTLRKYIRKGLHIQVFVNPSLGSESAVFDWLAAEAKRQGIISDEKA